MTIWAILWAIGGLVVLIGTICLVTSITKESGADLSPGWRLRCPKCGYTKMGAEVGMIRLGAASKGKRTLGFCSSCDCMRWIVIERYDASQEDALA